MYVCSSSLCQRLQLQLSVCLKAQRKSVCVLRPAICAHRYSNKKMFAKFKDKAAAARCSLRVSAALRCKLPLALSLSHSPLAWLCFYLISNFLAVPSLD